MKHIVTLTISNPSHEHVSLRRRQSTTNYMVEARDEAEAIFRASNHFKKLGNYVHSAVIAEGYMKNTLPDNEDTGEADVAEYERHMAKKPGVKAYDKEGNLVGHYRSMADAKKFKPGHTYKEVKEEVEQVEEETRLPPKFYKKIVDKLNKKKAGMKEEVEQIDELSSGLVRRYGGKAIRASLEARAKGDTATAYKRAKGVSLASAKAFPNQYKNSPDKAKVPATNEEVEQIDELSKKTLSSYVGKAYWDQGKRMAHGAEVYGYVAGKYGRKATRGEVFKNAKEMRRDKTRDTGVQRALSKLAKEEVEQVDEANSRHSPEAAQAVLTPRAKDVRNAMSNAARAKAATKKYARRVAKISPDYSKKDVMDHLKSMGEEVEQVSEVLKPSMGASAYIHDFVHSDNPKFAGKTKAERTKMALGAFYAAKKGK